MTQAKNTQIIVFYDSRWMIWVDNIIMFGGMFGLLHVNYTYWRGDWYISLAFIVMMLLSFAVKGKTHKFTFKDKEAAIEHIQNLK